MMMASTACRTSSRRCFGALASKAPVPTATTTTTSTTTSTTATTTTTTTTTSKAFASSQTLATNNKFQTHAPAVKHHRQGSGIGSDVEMIAANDRMHRSFSNDAMKDEYGAMDDSGDTYVYPGDYVLENGQTLPEAQLRYQTYGTLNAAKDNVLVICHALTGNASLHAWWGDLLGPQQPFNTDKYFVVCCNILGSCYGSTSPRSINPKTNKPYGKDFPDISVQDTVRLQLLMLQNKLQIKSIKAVIGGSFGGMQAVEFAVQAGTAKRSDAHQQRFTDSAGNPYVRSVVPIACGAQHTAWQIAISEVQRQAIYRDPAWHSDDPTQATAGLEIARQLGMVSYRTPKGYTDKFGRHTRNNDQPPYGSNAQWQVKSYLQYQGQKFLSRFDPITYVKMTEQMDSHNVARGRPGKTVADVLGQVDIPALVLGIDSDVLYPIQEQEELARLLPRAELKVIHSDDGHDGFLLEQEQVGANIIDFLDHHD